MNLFNPLKSERLELMNISLNKNNWPRNAYKNDAFYQYALSSHSLPISMMHGHYFAYTCYHQMTGQFVGYIQGYLPSIKDAIWIQTYLIDRKFLRQGYGREFYEHILKVLKSHVAFNKVYLACFEANEHGQLFWEKMNFKKVREASKLSIVKDKNRKVFIYEKELGQALPKEFLYEQENIKNLRIQ